MKAEAKTPHHDLQIWAALRDPDTDEVVAEVRAREFHCPGCIARWLRDVLAEIEEWA